MCKVARLARALAFAAMTMLPAAFGQDSGQKQEAASSAPSMACIRGRVLDVGRQPVANAVVAFAHELDGTINYSGGRLASGVERRAREMPGVQPPAGRIAGDSRTRDDGMFQIDGLVSGRFTLMAVHEKKGVAVVENVSASIATPHSAEPVEITFQAPTYCAARLADLNFDTKNGYVNLETESGWSNVQLDLRLEQTATAGEISTGPIPDGLNWRLVVWGRNLARGYGIRLHSIPVKIEKGSRNELAIDFKTGQRLQGQVTGPAGEPLADVAVRAHGRVEPRVTRGDFTNADGRYEIAGLLPGEYELEAVRHRVRSEVGCGDGAIDVQATKSIQIPVNATSADAPAAAEPGHRSSSGDVRVDELCRSLSVGDRAPNFTAQTISGEKISLEDYKGRVVLLDFWATWCNLCLIDLRHIAALHSDLSAKGGFAVVSVSLDSDPRAVERFLRRQNLAWPQLVLGPAATNPIAHSYNVRSTPTTMLIDRDGRIVARNVPGDELREHVRKLLERP